jgi:Spy/CpxP family protein refolding chaperone
MRAGVVAVLVVAKAVAAAEPPRSLFEQMVPPELVLAHADALGLDAEQRRAVRRVQARLQPRIPPLLREMREERDALVELLRLEKPDEAAVVARFDRLAAVETELKRVRLQMTVGVKRVLTAEQQAKALVLQAERPAGGGGAGADSLAAKLRRVKDGIEQWKREGRDVAPLREAWERFRAAEDRGFYRQARQALDEAIALLEAPPARR